MIENRKHVLDKFQEHLNNDYEAWCARHGVDKTKEHLVTFLIDHELIPINKIQRYAIKSEFEQLQLESIFQKTQSVSTLAHRFNLSERTVWNILKNSRPKSAKAK